MKNFFGKNIAPVSKSFSEDPEKDNHLPMSQQNLCKREFKAKF